jgi:hypothetical protein
MSDYSSDNPISSIENSPSVKGRKSAYNSASAAARAVKNHPITQSVTNGPVAENVKGQSAKAQAEFSNLAASRTTPTTPAATGQQLTHYHSFFSSLLSWNNPRASGIAYVSIVAFILAARYLDVLRYALKATYVILGVTVSAEAIGKILFSHGFATQFRPRKYYTVSKETINSSIGDIHELINFFVIEAQRILFAENVFASATAFLSAFISFYLIKIVPLWGLSLIATTLLFLAPLIYKTNKELIDTQVENITTIISQQTEQVKQLASQQAARATESTKHLVGDYSAKAQEMIGHARKRSTSPNLVKSEAAIKSEDFPAAPKEELQSEDSVEGSSARESSVEADEKPLIAA